MKTRLILTWLLLFTPLLASATVLTFENRWTLDNDGGWEDTYRNLTGYPVALTMRYTEGNSTDGDTYTNIWTLTLPTNEFIYISEFSQWDGQNESWRRTAIISEAPLMPPTITSAATKAATQGQPVTYLITTSGAAATSFGANNLPAGVSVNSSNGQVSGTPAVSGTVTSTITASNSHGSRSATLTWTIAGVSDAVPPASPANLQSSGVTFTAFTLTWSAATDNVGVTAYEIRRDGVTIGSSTNPSFNLTGLVQATSYAVAVRARDAAGNWSVWSPPLTVPTAADTAPPAVPAGLRVSAISSTGFTVTWDAATDNHGVADYEVRRNGASLGTASDVSRVFAGLDPFTSYAVEVRTRDLAGNWSAWSAPVRAITMTLESLTLIATSTWSNSTGNFLERTWRNNTTKDIRVFISSGARDDDPEFFQENTESLVLSPGHTIGEEDYERYSVEDDNWYYVWRSIAGQEVVGLPVVGNTSVVREPVGVPLSYQIAATNSPTSYSAANLPPGLALNASTGAISGTPTTAGTYNSTVRATNAIGTGVATLVWDLAIDTTPPAVPSNLAVAMADTGYFRASWPAGTDNYRVTGYEVRHNGVSSGVVSETYKRLPLGAANTVQVVEVRARDASGNWSAYSSPLNIPVYKVTVEYGTPSETVAIAGTTVGILANAPPGGMYFYGWEVASGPGSLASSAHPSATFSMAAGNAVLRPIYRSGFQVILPEGCTADAYGGPAGTVVRVTCPPPAPGRAFWGWDLFGAAEMERPTEATNCAVKLVHGDVRLTPWYLWNAANGYIWEQTATYVSGSGVPGKIGIGEPLQVLVLGMDYARPITFQRVEVSTNLGATWQIRQDFEITAQSNANYSVEPYLRLFVKDTRANLTFSSPGRVLIRSFSYDGQLVSMSAYTSAEVIEGTTITPPGVITRHPEDQAVVVVAGGSGGSALFSVGITGPPPFTTFTYAWRKVTGSDYGDYVVLQNSPGENGHISGADAATLTIRNVTAADAGVYYVVAQDGRYSYVSGRASLTVGAPTAPTITLQPMEQAVNAGDTASFLVRARGIPTPTYQWMKNGVAMPGANFSELRIPSVSPADAKSYSVRVDNSVGSVTSESAFLVVAGGATPPNVPLNVQVVATTATTVALSWSPPADAAGVVGYAIYRNGSAIAFVGASAAPGFIDSARSANGTYAYAVTALSAAGESPPTPTISATTTNGSIQTDANNTTVKLNLHLPSLP